MLIVNYIINCYILLVKPDNILLARDNKTIKLCDFGSALYYDEIGITEYVASRYYRAPEIILGCQFNSQVDMWGLGTTLYEIYTSKILFPGSTNNDMLRLILKFNKGKFNQTMINSGKFSNRHFDGQGIFKPLKGEIVVVNPINNNKTQVFLHYYTFDIDCCKTSY